MFFSKELPQRVLLRQFFYKIRAQPVMCPIFDEASRKGPVFPNRHTSCACAERVSDWIFNPKALKTFHYSVVR